jgi:hypothetical protein
MIRSYSQQKRKSAMNQTSGGIVISSQLLNLMSLVLGVAAAYFLTIQSLKIDLAAKAEATVVERLDKKLANIEVILKEGVVSREQFYDFSKDVEARLGRIEYYLSDQSGVKIGKR